MDYEKLFPGRFIKGADFGGKDITLTIASIRADAIEGKAKAIMGFENAKKELVLNRTNAEALKAMFGRETNNWIGKRVTFYPLVIKDPFAAEGEKADDIPVPRVRGSPDINEPISALVERGRGKRKKIIKVSVRPTGQPQPKKANGKPAAPSSKRTASKEEIDPNTGEVVPADAGVFPGEDGQL